MRYDTVDLDDDESALVIIDQTKLPNEVEVLHLSKQEDIHNAIYRLQVRGAPAIGVTAAIGLYLAAKEIDTDCREDFYRRLKEAKDYLASARPTAVNLFWALDRMEKAAVKRGALPVPDIKNALRDEALRIRDEDISVCRAIGEHGLT
jgi:methylthioribose-1-phosphate isomerase